MSIQFGSAFAQRLRSEVRQVPLQAGEIRSIIGMGATWIAPSSAGIDPGMCIERVVVAIDELHYAICRKNFQ